MGNETGIALPKAGLEISDISNTTLSDNLDYTTLAFLYVPLFYWCVMKSDTRDGRCSRAMYGVKHFNFQSLSLSSASIDSHGTERRTT